MDRQVQGQVRPGLGQAARRDAGSAEQAGRRPPGDETGAKPEAIKDWDKLTADEKKLFTREMEVFAGFGEYMDTEMGRLVNAIGDMGQLDNTLIFYIVGDNGASAEGGMNGMFNEMTYFNGVPKRCRTSSSTTTNWAARRPTAIMPQGGPWPAIRRSPGPSRSPRATVERATGWSSTGPRGERQRRDSLPMASCHRHRADRAGGRGLAAAEVRGWSPQTPIEGVSMLYSFKTPRQRTAPPQYFEISATVRSTTMAGSRVRCTRRHGKRSRGPPSRTTPGSSTTRPGLQPRK